MACEQVNQWTRVRNGIPVNISGSPACHNEQRWFLRFLDMLNKMTSKKNPTLNGCGNFELGAPYLQNVDRKLTETLTIV